MNKKINNSKQQILLNSCPPKILDKRLNNLFLKVALQEITEFEHFVKMLNTKSKIRFLYVQYKVGEDLEQKMV